MNTVTISQENIQSFQLPDIVKKISVKTIIISILLVIFSIALYYASNLFENNIFSSFLIFIGVFADCIMIFLLTKHLKSQVNVKTNSVVKKTCTFFRIEDYLLLKTALENHDYKSITNVKPQGEGNVQLCYVYSKDHQYLAVQLFKYEPFEFKPQTDIFIIEGDLATKFLKAMKHC